MLDVLLFLLIAGAIVLLPIACRSWQYQECRKVGHGAAWCGAKVMGCVR